MRQFLACLGLGLVLTGCASARLNYNTADLASSLGSLQKRQIFYNLAQALDDPEFIPSQVTISIGTVQTANAVNPNLSIPLGSSFASASRITDAGRNAGYQFAAELEVLRGVPKAFACRHHAWTCGLTSG